MKKVVEVGWWLVVLGYAISQRTPEVGNIRGRVTGRRRKE